MTDLVRHFLYAAWRFHVWVEAGNETYNTIDEKVGRGEMAPGVCPVEREHECSYRRPA